MVIDKGNNIRLVLGASGGTKIITAVAQVAIENFHQCATSADPAGRPTGPQRGAGLSFSRL